jgi:hypothetical protein
MDTLNREAREATVGETDVRTTATGRVNQLVEKAQDRDYARSAMSTILMLMH